MYFSGFEGETKQEMFRQLPPERCPITIYIEPGECFEQVLGKMNEAGLHFPVAAKPMLEQRVCYSEKLKIKTSLSSIICYCRLLMSYRKYHRRSNSAFSMCGTLVKRREG